MRNETRAASRAVTALALLVVASIAAALMICGVALVALGDVAMMPLAALRGWAMNADRWFWRCDWRGRRIA